MHVKIMNLKLQKNLLRPCFSSKLETTFAYFLFFFLQSNKTYYELETSRNHQKLKKNEWEKGGLIKVDENDDNEEITI